MSDALRARMAATGIGFAGLAGAWWRPAAEPFVPPVACQQQIQAIGAALCTFLDVVTTLYGTADGAAAGLTQLLDYKVPSHILRLMSAGRVESLRPDFQLVLERDATGAVSYRLVATELEICPSAHGFAHAMQLGYGLHPDLVHAFADYLAGRELLFVGTHQWSEFLIEQVAFCRALAAVGARGRVLYDRPFRHLEQDIQTQQRWQPPIFGVKQKTAGWQAGFLARLQAQNLDHFLYTPDDPWPSSAGDAVVFRFGYFTCFRAAHLHAFLHWQQQGATLLNPAQFILDSKTMMAALQLPQVRQRISTKSATALAWLDQAIPETILLTPDNTPHILADKDGWVVKFAGYDQGQQAWGGRSLQIGAYHSASSWQITIAQMAQLPWPVVAQRFTPSAQVDIAYWDEQAQRQWLCNGHTRLRVFFLRSSGSVTAAGAHLTVSGGASQVSEATDAVQAPVCFR